MFAKYDIVIAGQLLFQLPRTGMLTEFFQENFQNNIQEKDVYTDDAHQSSYINWVPELNQLVLSLSLLFHLSICFSENVFTFHNSLQDLRRKLWFGIIFKLFAVLPEQIHYDQSKALEKVINSNLGCVD